MRAGAALTAVLCGLVALVGNGQQNSPAFAFMDRNAIVSNTRVLTSILLLERIEVGDFTNEIKVSSAMPRAVLHQLPAHQVCGKNRGAPLTGAEIGISESFLLESRAPRENGRYSATVRDHISGCLPIIFESYFENWCFFVGELADWIDLFNMNIRAQLTARGPEHLLAGFFCYDGGLICDRVSLFQRAMLKNCDDRQTKREERNKPVWVGPYGFIYRYGSACLLGAWLGWLICRWIDKWG